MNPFMLGNIGNLGSQGINQFQEIQKNNLIKELLMNSLQNTTAPQVTGMNVMPTVAPSFGVGGGIPQVTPQVTQAPKDKQQMLKDLVTDKAFGSLMTRDPQTALKLMEYVGGIPEKPETTTIDNTYPKVNTPTTRQQYLTDYPTWAKTLTEEQQTEFVNTGKLTKVKVKGFEAKPTIPARAGMEWRQNETGGWEEKQSITQEELSKQNTIIETIQQKWFEKDGDSKDISIEQKTEVSQDISVINKIYEQNNMPIRLTLRTKVTPAVKNSRGQITKPEDVTLEIVKTTVSGVLDTTDTSQIIPEGVTEEDIIFTMKKHNLTREEVLSRLR